jgi:Fic family protein/predicted transcriptional regulator
MLLDLSLEKVLVVVRKFPESSSKEIYELLKEEYSYASIKRMLTKLLENKCIETKGNAKSTKYSLIKGYDILVDIPLEKYFELEIDQRKIKNTFNFELLKNDLLGLELFTEVELEKLTLLQDKFKLNISHLSEKEYKSEFERLAIDLSWKSSQIEGNTYSLLETERLLKDRETASGKTREEATMLLNHKEALDFILENPMYVYPLTISSIEDIHSVLVDGLDIERNIRRRRVGISGTNYRPIENEFQIKEALVDMCTLINQQKNIFSKSLLVLILLSYIQAFEDGNKRTARIISNALLIQNNYCPISFRTVDSIDYKKAMLLFYEQNNISAFKKIFIEQFEFAVNTYF